MSTANQQPVEAVLVSQAAPSRNQNKMQLALFDASGNPVTVVQTSAAMVITGYVIAGAAAALAATDTLNVALGKLEKRIAVLEAA